MSIQDELDKVGEISYGSNAKMRRSAFDDFCKAAEPQQVAKLKSLADEFGLNVGPDDIRKFIALSGVFTLIRGEEQMKAAYEQVMKMNQKGRIIRP